MDDKTKSKDSSEGSDAFAVFVIATVFVIIFSIIFYCIGEWQGALNCYVERHKNERNLMKI